MKPSKETARPASPDTARSITRDSLISLGPWPIFKSRNTGSELSRGGPMVGDEVIANTYLQHSITENEQGNLAGTVADHGAVLS